MIGDDGGGVNHPLATGDEAIVVVDLGQHHERRLIRHVRVIRQAGWAIALAAQLKLGQVVDAVVVAVGRRWVGRDVDGNGGGTADGDIPSPCPHTGRFACGIVGLVPNLLAIGQTIVVGIGAVWVGAELRLLQIGQPVAVGVAGDGRIGRAILAAL